MEAACRHWGRAAGLQRVTYLHHWADFDAAVWQEERQAAEALARPITPGQRLLMGTDRNPKRA